MRKTFAIIFRYLFPAVGWLLLVWFGSGYILANAFPWVHEEIGRLPSPGGQYEAVVTRANRGAMSSYRYAICIVKTGQPYDTGRVNFDSSDLVVSNVVWSSANRLTIRHNPRRIYYFKPIWPDDTGRPGDHLVEIDLDIMFDKDKAEQRRP